MFLFDFIFVSSFVFVLIGSAESLAKGRDSCFLFQLFSIFNPFIFLMKFVERLIIL